MQWLQKRRVPALPEKEGIKTSLHLLRVFTPDTLQYCDVNSTPLLQARIALIVRPNPYTPTFLGMGVGARIGGHG
jgi:hypothetical protein